MQNTTKKDVEFVLNHNFRGVFVNEAETIITFSRLDARAHVYTTESTMLTKLKALLRKDPENWKLEDYTVSAEDPEVLTSVEFSCPRKLVSFRTTLPKKEYSDEEKIALANRFKKAQPDENM